MILYEQTLLESSLPETNFDFRNMTWLGVLPLCSVCILIYCTVM